MYLFILESIGTQELILVGIVALIVFGPRKLPQMARKAGQIMRELRSVSNDFKSTWAQEVKLAEDEISVFTDPLSEKNITPKEPTVEEPENTIEKSTTSSILPEVREVSEEDFKKLIEEKKKVELSEADKENWL